MFSYLFLLLVLIVSNGESLYKQKDFDIPQVQTASIDDSPLILTSLLERGKYKKAQKLSKVTPDIGNMTSYAGFFKVNKECDNNLFFWFFPAQKDTWKDAPLLLWMNGGSDRTSMVGLFQEVGPFEFYKEGLKRRELSWNVENNLLFIDQPVGVGYSFTKKECYPTNQTGVGEDLYQAVLQFHQLFPTFQKNKFIISGESLSGHFIPTLGHAIHQHNPSAKVKINLSAMMIGNGWHDPVSQIDYGNYLHNLGLIDDAQNAVYQKYQELFVEAVASEDWKTAEDTSDLLIGELFSEYVGDVDLYNYLSGPRKEDQSWELFMQSAKVRKSLHVGNLPFQNGSVTAHSLRLDGSRSTRTYVEELLESYPIIFYNGELDILCAYPMQIKFLRSLSWSAQDEYLNATRSKWCVGNDQAGYFKGQRNLYDVLVRRAGHRVPADQPAWAYTLVNSVTSGNADNPLHLLTQCNATVSP